MTAGVLGDPAATVMARLVLGTVQIGLPYGRLRNSALMPQSRAWAILDAAWESGIRVFDTAEGYGHSATRLSRWISTRRVGTEAHVITKVQIGNASTLSEAAEIAVARFRDCASVTLLSHGPADGKTWQTMLEVCDRSGSLAGQSVYTAEEVLSAASQPRVSRVQAPANALDRRVILARGEADVALDLRSVFLQGLLLEEPSAAERRVPGAGRLVISLQKAARAVNCPLSSLLLADVLCSSRSEDRVVVGVDTPEQVAAATAGMALSRVLVRDFRAELNANILSPIDLRILDPRTW